MIENVSFRELCRRVKDNELNIPSEGQREPEWKSAQHCLFQDSLFKIPYSSGHSPIIVVKTKDKSLPYQKMDKCFNIFESPETEESFNKDTPNIGDGSQRIRSCYSSMYGSIMEKDSEKEIYFNIVEQPVFDTNYCHFKLFVPDSIFKKGYYRYKILINLIEQHLKNKISFREMINFIKEDIVDYPHDYIESNVIMLMDSALFQDIIDLKYEEISLPFKHTRFMFDVWNKRKGVSITGFKSLFIDFKSTVPEYEVVREYCDNNNILYNNFMRMLCNITHDEYIDINAIKNGNINVKKYFEYDSVINTLNKISELLIDHDIDPVQFLKKVAHNGNLLYTFHRKECYYLSDEFVQNVKNVLTNSNRGDSVYKKQKVNIINNDIDLWNNVI